MGVRVTVTALASQYAVLVRPSNGATGRLVAVCHGAFPAWNFVTDHSVSWPKLRDMAFYLADRGYAVLVPELSVAGLVDPFDTWGNNASTTQLDDVITAAKALPGVSAGNYAVIGCSMGCVTALNHIRRKSYSGIAGVLGLAPAVAISPYRGTDAAQGSFYAEVNSAFAVANDAAWEAAKTPYEPIAFASAITVPVALWTNSNDLVATPTLADLMRDGNPTMISRTNLGVSGGASGHDFDLVSPDAVANHLAGLAW